MFSASLEIVLTIAYREAVSRRHAYLASLVGIPHLVVAVNKMDLVDYSREVFERIYKDFDAFAKGLELRNIAYIPMSALNGSPPLPS